MIGTIRKHSKWLWGIVITATIVTFVFWGGQGGCSERGRFAKVDRGRIDGKEVTEKAFRQAEREVSLFFFMHYQDWPDRNLRKIDFDMHSVTYQQLFLIRKLEEYNIHVDSAAVGKAVAESLRQFAQSQRLSRVPTLDEFVQQVLVPHANADDLQRYFQHQLGIDQLRQIVGLGGELVTPEEAQVLYVRDHQELATDAVFFAASNFLAAVPVPTPEAVAKFYEINGTNLYTLPERVQVSYLPLDVTNFLAEADKQLQADPASVSNQVETVYRQRTNSLTDILSPEDSKERIRQQMRHELALMATLRKASELLDVLLSKEPARPEDLASVAASNGLNVAVSQPFDEENGPTEFDGGPGFARASFTLTDGDPFFPQPVGTTNTVYLIAFKRRIPSELPPLDTLRARVTADYIHNEARQLALLAGMQFSQTASNSLVQGKTFVGICAEAKVKREPIPPIAGATRSLPIVEDHLSLQLYKQIAFTTPIGKASLAQPTADGAVVVYVQERLPINQARMNAELPAFVDFLRQQRTQEAFLNWFNREFGRAVRDIPAPPQKS